MAKTHASLLSDFKIIIADTGIDSDKFDFYINNTLPTFLRRLSKFGLDRSHLQYIPRLKLSLTADTWEYSWLNVAKYSNAATSDTAGLISGVTGAISTYYLAPGDLATYNSVDYYVHNVTSTTIQLDTSVGNVSQGIYIYARPLYFTDGYILESGGTAGLDEIPVKRSGGMLAPGTDYVGSTMNINTGPNYRVRGDVIEISWNPETGDYLHLFYVPAPIKFDNTNAIMTALTNPTQLTDEANNALLWETARTYWLKRRQKEDADIAGAMADSIMGTAGFSKGQIEW